MYIVLRKLNSEQWEEKRVSGRLTFLYLKPSVRGHKEGRMSMKWEMVRAKVNTQRWGGICQSLTAPNPPTATIQMSCRRSCHFHFRAKRHMAHDSKSGLPSSFETLWQRGVGGYESVCVFHVCPCPYLRKEKEFWKTYIPIYLTSQSMNM